MTREVRVKTLTTTSPILTLEILRSHPGTRLSSSPPLTAALLERSLGLMRDEVGDTHQKPDETISDREIHNSYKMGGVSERTS